jgi:hypothetical protein
MRPAAEVTQETTDREAELRQKLGDHGTLPREERAELNELRMAREAAASREPAQPAVPLEMTLGERLVARVDELRRKRHIEGRLSVQELTVLDRAPAIPPTTPSWPAAPGGTDPKAPRGGRRRPPPRLRDGRQIAGARSSFAGTTRLAAATSRDTADSNADPPSLRREHQRRPKVAIPTC